MKTVPLTQDKVSIVDDTDFEWLNEEKWSASWDGHYWRAVRVIWQKEKKTYKTIYMHRQILNALPHQQIDHINHNTLDNRRCNLRICTRSENQHNRRPNSKGTSKYKGVSWNKNTSKWRAVIRYNKKTIHLGLFNDEIKAAEAYDVAAKQYFGEFAVTNFKSFAEVL